MGYLAAIEVDKRQNFITSAHKLKEMLGGSWTIEATKKLTKESIGDLPNIEVVKAASGDIWLHAEDLPSLETCLWRLREKIVYQFGLPCSFAIVSETGNFNTDRTRLLSDVKRVKRSKAGAVAAVALPWLAPCQIQPAASADKEPNDNTVRNIEASPESPD